MPNMNWSTFDCPDANFFIRSLPDGNRFGVKKKCLEDGSEVFRDMFSCCELGAAGNLEDPHVGSVDLDEPAQNLIVLLRILHEPPMEYLQVPEPTNADIQTQITIITPTSAIPLPLFSLLLRLADKYMLAPPFVRTLHTHLAAHKSTFPLQVYGLAAQLGLDTLAAETSYYLLHPPLHTYHADQIRAIPTAEAYHRLVRLHAHRVAKLRELTLSEEIFPHGYGECSAHKVNTLSVWDKRRRTVASQIESGTDVAAEMSTLIDDLSDCITCYKAFIAATEMLAYKCRRVARRIDEIPSPDE